MLVHRRSLPRNFARFKPFTMFQISRSFLWLPLWRIAYGSSFCRVLFSYNRNAAFVTNVSLAKSVSAMWFKDRPPPHLGKIANYFVIITVWAIIPDPTTIEHRRETDTKWTWLLSWIHLIHVHQKLVFEMGKIGRASVTGNHCKTTRRKLEVNSASYWPVASNPGIPRVAFHFSELQSVASCLKQLSYWNSLQGEYLTNCVTFLV